MKAILVAGTHSGCGKTTVALGLMAAFRKRGLSVQGFKVGPDYIDQGLHGMVTGRPARNLDTFMMDREFLEQSFYTHSSEADVSVVEGVMGIFDGDFGTWSVAKLLGIPVLLVVDTFGMAETLGPILKGLANEARSRGIQILGCIFSKTGSHRHIKRLTNSSPIPVLGYIPRDKRLHIPSRHLGLLVAEENPLGEEEIAYLSKVVEENVDLDRILQTSIIPGPSKVSARETVSNKGGVTKTVLVAKDKAFCFYYQDNLDAIEASGCKIQYFSPIEDESIPNCDGIYIGGGYPEVHAKAISKNKSLLHSIREMAMDGIPIYAECGGLILLSQGVVEDKTFNRMAGVFPFDVIMGKSPYLGYRKVELLQDCILGKKSHTLKGHEFHYSNIQFCEKFDEVSKVFKVSDQYDSELFQEGYRLKNTIATYIHIHFNGKNPFGILS